MCAMRYYLCGRYTQHIIKVIANSQEGQTPLLLAIRKNNTAMVKELVRAGADVDYMAHVCGNKWHLP